MLPLVGKKCYQAYHGRTSACEVCPSLRAMKEKTMQMDTVPYIGESGFAGWLELYSSPLEDDHGNVIGVIEHVREVTERKRTERALVRDRYILTKSQEIAHLGNWAFDVETEEFTGSAENDRIFGFEPGEVKATAEWVLSRVIPEDRAELAAYIEARTQDGMRGSIDYRIVRPDGSVRYVNSIVDKAVRDESGRIKRLYGISQDVTDSKRAEEALRESEKKFRVLAETSPAAIFLYQGEKYVYVNLMAETLTGYSRDELLAGDASDWIHPEFKDLVKEPGDEKAGGRADA